MATEKQARTWSWISLVLGVLVLLGSLSSANIPVALTEAVSIAGSVLFLFGGDSTKNTAMVLLYIAGFLEAFASVALLLFGTILLLNPAYLFGWAFLIGIASLVLFVPVAALATLDLLTARVVAEVLEEREASEAKSSLEAPKA
eukprot:3119296-Prymnesium_polylepis.1